MTTPDTVVTFIYTLTVDGQVLDRVDAGHPVIAKIGTGYDTHRSHRFPCTPGLIASLVGKRAGEKYEVDVQPEAGYGIYHPGRYLCFKPDDFAKFCPGMAPETLSRGTPLELFDASGNCIGHGIFMEANTYGVLVDYHHFLAGETLHYQVTILKTRPFTAGEQKHRNDFPPGYSRRSDVVRPGTRYRLRSIQTVRGNSGVASPVTRTTLVTCTSYHVGSNINGMPQDAYAATAGRYAGEAFEVTLAPDQAYGLHKRDLVWAIRRADFAERCNQTEPPTTGMSVTLYDEEGEPRGKARVLWADSWQVMLDHNHVLAGCTLHYQMEILSVEPLTNADWHTQYRRYRSLFKDLVEPEEVLPRNYELRAHP